MSKANKTQKTQKSVEEFLQTITSQEKQDDCFTLLAIMKRTTELDPKMWGAAIIGFGAYHYKYESGREGDFFRIGFSPRAQYISVYVVCGYDELSDELARLGKYKKGKSCLNIRRLSDIDINVLTTIISKGFACAQERYPV